MRDLFGRSDDILGTSDNIFKISMLADPICWYILVLLIEMIAGAIVLGLFTQSWLGCVFGAVGILVLSFIPYVRWIVAIFGTVAAALVGWIYHGIWGALPLGAIALAVNVAVFRNVDKGLEHQPSEAKDEKWWHFDWLD